ncbi:MAG: hypothetical protein P8Q48_08335 [Paracoccaceae bacterium]|nr:hypothetical protein [Paracoccaceae bacterium]MDG1370233.1 hypothetical protein [Paracoccaceae bacterium]
MPIEYWILRDAHITYARWYDHIDTAQMRRNFESYLIDPHYRAGRPELIGLSRVTSSDVDIGGVMMILNKANAQDFGQNPGTLTFILAADENSYGHSRQFQSLADTRGGVQIHISDSEAAALAVLDRPETDLESFLTGQSDYKPK